ncbi:MAG: MFS transporter [Saprospiraceae bacterium]
MLQTDQSTTTQFISALQIPDFRKLISLNFFLTLSLLMLEVLVSYELYLVTKDPLSLGLIGLAIAIPYISLSLVGGHFADKQNKKVIMFFSMFALFIISLLFLLIFNSNTNEYISLSQKVMLIYLFFGIAGFARGFYQPAASSFRPYLLPRNLYANGSTWNSTAWQLGTILGSILAGFCYTQFGIEISILISSSFLAISILLLLLIKTKSPSLLKLENEHATIFTSIQEGFSFVLNNKILLYSISLDLVAVLFAGAIAILPVFAQDILNIGASGLGWLRAAPSLGAFLGLLLMTKFSPMNKAWRNMILAASGFGIATIIFAVSTNIYLSLFMLFFTGAFDSISVVIRGSLLQIIPPDHLRGRVLAVNNIFVSSSNEVGAFESGLAAKLFGTVRSVVFGGIATLIVIGTVYFNSKELLDKEIQ